MDIKAETILNREGDVLPFGYFNPDTDGKLVWVCNEDAAQKITHVFDFDMGNGNHQKQCAYIESIEEAIKIRDELIAHGWKKLVPPEVTFKFKDEKEDRPLTRQEKRILKRKLKKMDKDNPFNK